MHNQRSAFASRAMTRSHAGKSMNPYYNLPPEQRRTQRLVDQFNADEKLWKKLEPKRRARRKLRPRRSRKELKKIDLFEFAKARPPQDCIGEWVEAERSTPLQKSPYE